MVSSRRRDRRDEGGAPSTLMGFHRALIAVSHAEPRYILFPVMLVSAAGAMALSRALPMVLRLNSLQTRTALAIASVIVASLLANSAYLFYRQHKEIRAQIRSEAENFAQLATGSICSAYETFYTSEEITADSYWGHDLSGGELPAALL